MLKQCPRNATYGRTYATDEDRAHLMQKCSVLNRVRPERGFGVKEQTQAIADTGGPIPGDCWRTAVACLLEVERDVVPHFVADHWDDKDQIAWWRATVAYVESTRPGFTLVSLTPYFPVYAEPDNAPSTRVILTGRSPRGEFLHAVIADALTGTTVWDVHPDRTGLLEPLDVVAALVLKPLAPAWTWSAA